MKKKLEAELIIIAHKILKLKGKDDVIKMHAEVSVLFEKLSVLKFAHETFEEDIPVIANNASFFGMLDQAFNNKVSDNIEVGDKIYVNLDEIEEDDIMEPGIETIKDIVAQMPYETQEVDALIEEVTSKPTPNKSDLDNITAGFKNMPVFEPVSKVKNGTLNDKKSLNDKLKNGGLNIGLNDKIAFIKHLFDGKPEDYERVISQINSFVSFNEAKHFIEDIVKPDYNNWTDKDDFEVRFLEIIEGKF